MAKRYGSAHSSQFVNGILDKLLASHRKPRLVGLQFREGDEHIRGMT
ncbi:MAG: hypothetical protein QM775_33440 [Pirellulales bacterium]